MKELQLVYLLLLISLVTNKKSAGDNLRKFTDKNIFGEDPAKRNPAQAITRDFVHGVYHTGSAINNFMKGNNQGVSQDLKRAGEHFSGENLKQIQKNKRSGGGGGHGF